MNFTMEWLKAAMIRAVRTMAQVALTYITVGKLWNEIDWGNLLSLMAVSGVYSLLTSIVTKLPEVGSDGTLFIDDSGDTTKMLFTADSDPYEWAKKASVRLKVDVNGYPNTEGVPVVDLEDSE